MKKLFFITLMSGLVFYVCAEEIDIYKDIRVLDYYYHTLNIQSKGMLTNARSNNVSSFLQGGVSIYYLLYLQNPDWLIDLESSDGYKYTRYEYKNYDESQIIDESQGYQLSLSGDTSYFFNTSTPIPVSIDNYVSCEIINKKEIWNILYSIRLEPGIGFGRIIDVGHISKAYELCKALGFAFNEDELDMLAEMIGKELYYQFIYGDDFEKKFYNALNGIMRNQFDVLDIKRVYERIEYPYATKTGLELRMNYDLLSSSETQEFDQGIAATVSFAEPFFSFIQLVTDISYYHSLMNLNEHNLDFSSRFSFTHTNQWQSFFGVTCNVDFALPAIGFGIQAGSDVYLLGSLIASVLLSLHYDSENSAEAWKYVVETNLLFSVF